jgi:hypothetical protein
LLPFLPLNLSTKPGEVHKGLTPTSKDFNYIRLSTNEAGARSRTRTGTGVNPRDFKSLASTYSATRAYQ